MAVDADGNIYISQITGSLQRAARVRKITASSGYIETVAGSGIFGSLNAGGPALVAGLNEIYGLGLDGQGNLYVGTGLSVVCKIDAASQVLTIVAGKPTGNAPFDGALSDAVQFNDSASLSVDRGGNLYLVDSSSNLVEVLFSEGFTIFSAPLPGSTVAPRRLSVVNSGNQDLTLNSQELNGPYQLQAADSNACQFPGTLTPGASCALEIEGAMPGRIDPGSLILFDSALHRVAIHPVLLQFEFPNPVLSATSLNFGNYAVQGQFGGNQWLSLSNPDSKASLVVHSLTFTGANAGDFSISPGSSCTFVDVGSGCQLNVTFTPQGPGPRTASLVITSNAAESPQTVELTGGAVTPPQISVNTETLSFGEQVIETRGEIKSVTVSNTGGASLIFLPASNVFLSTSAESGFSIVQSTCPAIELAAGQSCTFAIEFKPRLVGLRTARLFIYYKIAGMQSSSVVSIDGTGVPPPKFRFIPIEPCRVADTRNAIGPYGGPAIAAQSTRDFDVPGSTCGVPGNAAAYAMNVTVVPEGPLSWLTVWPSGQPKPTVSTLNSYDGKIKANAVIVPAGINGAISLFATDQTEAILDINGYFAPVSDSAGLSFYPLPACRVTDTREPDPGFGGPALRANQEREIAILTSQCHIPAGAQAYSLNFTAVPRTALGYLTVWPSGRSRPLVSTLNSPTGTVVANAAIIPAGQGGDISVYATEDSELIIDVNGYFAPPSAEGLSLYTVAPCRVLDSREDQAGQLEGARGVAFQYSLHNSQWSPRHRLQRHGGSERLSLVFEPLAR